MEPPAGQTCREQPRPRPRTLPPAERGAAWSWFRSSGSSFLSLPFSAFRRSGVAAEHRRRNAFGQGLRLLDQPENGEENDEVKEIIDGENARQMRHGEVDVTGMHDHQIR